ncbi:MAG: hypothetical protein JNN05_11280, partial [Candidatus Omnitrophica bacterium]|nr:hypothetical protein [Candidatus Omnitrophota bacterium]
YSLTTGRFLQRDPLGYADSMNLYQYARNNPVNLIDPMGKEVVIPGPWMASPYYWMGVAVVSGYIAWNAAHNSSRGFHLPDLNWDWQLPTFPSNNLEKSNMCILRSGKNRIPDQGVPGTIATNGPGTTKKLYGDDGWVTLEWNKGHTDHAVGTVERDDHVHPQTTQPNGKATDRGEARKPTKEDKEKLKLP